MCETWPAPKRATKLKHDATAEARNITEDATAEGARNTEEETTEVADKKYLSTTEGAEKKRRRDHRGPNTGDYYWIYLNGRGNTYGIRCISSLLINGKDRQRTLED